MKAMVVGGRGFIGSHVCSSLFTSGYDVTSLDRRDPSGKEEFACITADIADHESMRNILAGTDVVIALAASSLPANSNTHLASEVRSHVEATVALAEIAAQAGVSRFVFASSGGTIYGRRPSGPIAESALPQPITGYGASKLAVEQYLRVLGSQSGMTSLSLRIANPYGPGQRIERRQGVIAAAIDAAQTQKVMEIWGDGEVVRDFVYVGDVAGAFAAACGYEGDCNAINIGSGVGLRVLDAIHAVEQVFETSIDIEFLPGRKIDVPESVLDVGAARSELGWTPSSDLTSGLRRTREYLDGR